MNPCSPKTTKSTATTLMSHIPPKRDKQYTVHWMDKVKTCDYIVWQLPIKYECWDAPLALRNLPEILDLESSWKSQPAITKISTVHDKIFTCQNISLPFMIKSQPFIIKSRPITMKISTVHNKISTFGQNGFPQCLLENSTSHLLFMFIF